MLNNSSPIDGSSLFVVLSDVRYQNGPAGRHTPRRTGAIREFAICMSSGIAIINMDWKTFLHLFSCWKANLKIAKLKFLSRHITYDPLRERSLNQTVLELVEEQQAYIQFLFSDRRCFFGRQHNHYPGNGANESPSNQHRFLVTILFTIWQSGRQCLEKLIDNLKEKLSLSPGPS